MPRTTAYKEKYMLDDLQKLIEHRKIELAMYNRDIAEAMGLCENTINSKIRTGDWSRRELIKLFNILQMTDEEILLCMRKQKYVMRRAAV